MTSGCSREAEGQLVELLARHHAARGIGRAVDDDQPRARGDVGQHLLGREREALVLVERDRHRLGARELDHGAVNRKAWVGVHDLGARLAEHGDREIHGDLAARHDHDPVGVDLDAPPLLDVLGDRLAQGQDAVCRRVAVVAVGQRLLGGGDDVLGVGKSGWPIPRLMMLRPLWASSLARASTSKALSVPSRYILSASIIVPATPAELALLIRPRA